MRVICITLRYEMRVACCVGTLYVPIMAKIPAARTFFDQIGTSLSIQSSLQACHGKHNRCTTGACTWKVSVRVRARGRTNPQAIHASSVASQPAHACSRPYKTMLLDGAHQGARHACTSHISRCTCLTLVDTWWCALGCSAAHRTQLLGAATATRLANAQGARPRKVCQQRAICLFHWKVNVP